MKTDLNVLLITLDDMNYNSHDFLRHGKEDLTPHMDALARDALTLENSHVTIALCQPSRSVLMTGRYPHLNGARGFEAIHPHVVPLPALLHDNGYFTAIIGKETHLEPREAFAWDRYIRTYREEDGFGRSPSAYYSHCSGIFQEAERQGKPFFMMANSHDPHRPFAGSADEIATFGRNLPVNRTYSEEDVQVPGFLPDLPDIRTEVAQYLTSVHRADETVGEILRALQESGLYDRTIIMLLSDNGMAFPFAKANCYLNSTKSPYIFRVPGKTGTKFKTPALVSGIDYMPTILDLLGLPCPPDIDGRSFAHLLNPGDDEHYEDIFTFFFKTAKNPTTKGERHYPMRCVQDRKYAYIYNAWSGGETDYLTESMSGLSYKAMAEAGPDDPEIAVRVNMLLKREPEELYDLENDPDATRNLAHGADSQMLLAHYRERMRDYLSATDDDLLEVYIEHLS